jgi:hypothetical protein
VECRIQWQNGAVAGYEFREGNAAPAARNLEFMQACERNMPKAKKIAAVRADSAAYRETSCVARRISTLPRQTIKRKTCHQAILLPW